MIGDEVDAMELFHNRLNHASMDSIKTLAGTGMDFGVKIGKEALRAYECVPCIESKMKRMIYRTNPRRATKLLEKVSVDVCAINESAVDKSEMFLLVMDTSSRGTMDVPA